jgi:glycosyltransferase involved in cell wall biosynthesis
VSMSFSVVTPTFNANRWIRACVNSVADQQNVSVQHIVQDGLSKDGTAEYVVSEPRIEGVSTADRGMYDAINQGWAKCTGDYFLHLNADEQLLPGALEAVGTCFEKNPEVDVVYSGAIICNQDGSLHCYRKALRPPLSILLTSHHPVQTCSIFFRRSSFLDRPWFYDPQFRYGSDVHLVIDVVKAKKKSALLDQITSAFFLTGDNIGLARSAAAEAEYAYQLSLAPRWMSALSRPIRVGFHCMKLASGHYTLPSISYEIYPPDGGSSRQEFHIPKPSGVYRPYKAA